MSKREGREFLRLFGAFYFYHPVQKTHTRTHVFFVDLHYFRSIARCKARTRRGGVDLGHSVCDENRHAHTKTRSRAKENSLFFGNNFVEHKRARWENERRKKLLVSLTSFTSKSSRETKEDQEKETVQHVHV